MRFFLMILIFLSSFGISYGEELNSFSGVELNSTGSNLANTGGIIQPQIKCVENKYEIVGDKNTKINSTLVYSIKNNFVGEGKTDTDILFLVSQNGTKITEKKVDKFNIVFSEVGLVDIKATVKEKGSDCVYNLENQINVFSKIVTFISDKNDLNLSFSADFNKNHIYFDKTILEYKNSSSVQDQFLSQITEKLYTFQDSDIIIIDSNNFLEILQGFEKLSNVYNINFPNKKIFIVTNSSFILSKKLLSSFINNLNINIFTFSPSNLLNFLNYISLGKSSTNIINNEDYGITQISFDISSNKLFFLTNFTNKLILSGFPISILGIIFSIGIAVTVINFIRQFIGISIFNLYYPIFFALSIYLFSLQITLILFVASIFSMYFMKMIYKKVHFLLNTKLSLFLILYLIISLIIFGLLNSFNLLDFYDLKGNLVVFPFIVIPMVAYKIFADERKIISIGFLLYFLEFAFVSTTAFYIIQSSYIQNIFLAYTELLLIVFLLNFMIGKFTGLQLLEYIRFLPLIKRHFHDEE